MKKKATINKEISKKDYKYFESLLVEERKKIIGNLMNLDTSNLAEHNSGIGEDISDYAETGTDAFDIQVALSLASEESQIIQEIDEAIERIKSGSFGICEMCKKPIPRKRLEAIPHARYCIQCQSEYEKQQDTTY
ncbi:MAG TPA: TraR/DksA C4-type zinc finger protein [Candidatus Hydrogenedens sp.]|nr:TraR/DksA C4-type zinc finger protein [Candidatus Hydrogenedens sp.]HOK08187.1 TraR/DksA C4-type zinc finger protein [Candidatus Hydrogenedens sp.]HOL20879.1 TraR/DksA C4-type zinc finger protein [Candidatus Hydrogenedens sp.]HPP58656.1 TraR/DksA C4-type zinc finger protein [Candidatus Hydrogenedens sp.]